MIKRLACLVLGVLVGSSAVAQVNPYWGHVVQNGASAIEYVTGGAQFVDGVGGATFVGRTFSTPSPGTTSAYRAFANETLRLGVAGNDLTVLAARGMTGLEIATGAAAALAVGAVAFDAVGSPIAKALGYDQFTMGNTRCTAHYVGWQCDSGTDPVPGGGGVCYPWLGNNGVKTPCVATQAEAIAYARAQPGYQTYYPPTGSAVQQACTNFGATNIYSAVSFAIGQGVADSTHTGCVGFNNGGAVNQGAQSTLPTSQSCPASIDALNPAWSVPAGNPPDADGKCKSGRYGPQAVPYVADRIDKYGDPSGFGDLARHVVDDLGQPITVGNPANLTGPGTLTGQPTTEHTVNPDGTTKDVTRTPTTSYTYNNSPNTINYNTTTVVVTNNAGNVSTVTTTTPGAVPPDPTDPCVKNAGTFGCSKPGDPPSDAPTWTSKPIDFAPVVVSSVASCPPDFTGTVRGWTLRMAFKPACDVAPNIRVAVLVLATISATMMVVLTVARS